MFSLFGHQIYKKQMRNSKLFLLTVADPVGKEDSNPVLSSTRRTERLASNTSIELSKNSFLPGSLGSTNLTTSA